MERAPLSQLERRLKALADPTRMKIVALLERRPLCVCEITDALALAQPTVSRHLRALETAGFLTRRRQGAWVIYSLAPADQLCVELLSLVLPRITDDPQVVELRRRLASVSRSGGGCGQGCGGEGGGRP